MKCKTLQMYIQIIEYSIKYYDTNNTIQCWYHKLEGRIEKSREERDEKWDYSDCETIMKEGKQIIICTYYNCRWNKII